MSSTEDVLGTIARERLRQDTLKAEGRFRYTLADNPGLDDGEKYMALGEEMGEISRAILARRMLVTDGDTDLPKELTQLAALCVAWLEALTGVPRNRFRR